uniref:Uncharacterized protein n=1 Tax=Micrurus corallinus TaxID=54390 RepID=A0A2D4GDQ8_MICCO
MAMLRDVNHDGLFPAEEEVARASAGGHGDAEISVVGHEDEHQEVADHHLQDVKDGLEEVREAQHLLADCFVRFHQDGPVGPRERHGVVTDTDLRLPEEAFPANLQALVEHGQEENSHKCSSHFSGGIDDEPRKQQRDVLIPEVKSHIHHSAVHVSGGFGGVMVGVRIHGGAG